MEPRVRVVVRLPLRKLQATLVTLDSYAHCLMGLKVLVDLCCFLADQIVHQAGSLRSSVVSHL